MEKFFDGEMIFCLSLLAVSLVVFIIGMIRLYLGDKIVRLVRKIKKRIAIIVCYFCYPAIYKEYVWKSRSHQSSER